MKFQQFSLPTILIIAFITAGCGQPTTTATNNAAANVTNTAVANTFVVPVVDDPTERSSTGVELDVPYVPTPTAVVNEMLAMAEVNGSDVLYDLGSGDGRIPIAAAKKFGTRGVGIDLNPVRVEEATRNAQKDKVDEKVRFVTGDIFKEDFSEATVVTLYLLPDVNLKLRPQLLNMKPGTRVVSHNYDMGDWMAEKTKHIRVDGVDHYVYFWRVPEKQ